MGQEVHSVHFRKQDFVRFARHLERETALLREWFAEQSFSSLPPMAGFELEACLVDSEGMPAAINEEWLALLGKGSLFTPELSRFNVELNSVPLVLHGTVLSRMRQGLQASWDEGQRISSKLDARLLMIGILPTLDEAMLSLKNMSAMTRFRALNEQVLRLREGRPLVLDIRGDEHLHTQHGDVMLEAATTSFQLHLQVAQQDASRFYNVLQILSAPMVAISANSPLLFGKRLWQETRVPLFEQATAVGWGDVAEAGTLGRVSFGSGYAREGLLEIFEENLRCFVPMLPVDMDEEPEKLAHLRLHNGTIWRWNRPLIGFDRDGRPHLRLEHRVIPAGPTVVDSIANAALLYGLAFGLAEEPELESRLAFADARDNFYLAARDGLAARVVWLDGQRGRLDELLERLLPLAHQGLARFGCDVDEAQYYLGIITARLRNGQTGARWQRQAFERYHGDSRALVAEYLNHQERGEPVHRW